MSVYRSSANTEMKKPQVLILLMAILVHVGAGFPFDTKPASAREKSASWDDVNVVAHGLLQLGQGLKEHVDKTKAQMRDVNSKLREFNSTMANLGRRQREQGEALKARGEEVEEKVKMAADLVEEVRVKVEEVKKQNKDMDSRIGRLEKVEEALTEPSVDSNDSHHAGVSFVQRLVAAQNSRIDQLVEKIKQQQDKLERQSLHLQALQNKVTHKRIKSHRRRDEGRALSGEALSSTAESGLARDCHDLFLRGQRTSGIYAIQPESYQPFNVLCEMTSEGGWTVIQKRQDGSQNFKQLWETYRKGFGSLNGEFWLGLENIHSLSKQGPYILQVDLSDQAGQQHAARYQFQLDGEEENFKLHLMLESSSADQEEILNTGASGLPFSTADRDNDLAADTNCAQLHSGGWWFGSCGGTNLNGRYPRGPSGSSRHQSRRQLMFWTSTEGRNSPKTTVLKIAPATINQ